jgi:hypothetical protein
VEDGEAMDGDGDGAGVRRTFFLVGRLETEYGDGLFIFPEPVDGVDEAAQDTVDERKGDL